MRHNDAHQDGALAGAGVMHGRDGRDVIDGGAGVDTIYGSAGFDAVYSADLVDTIIDSAGGYELLLALPAAPAAPRPGDDAVHVATGDTVDIPVLDNDRSQREPP